MRFKFLVILILMFLTRQVFCEEPTILYMSDNIHLGDHFVTKYADMLQTLMDDNYGKDTIKLKKISKFDFNTTECFDFLKQFNTKNDPPKIVIITVGEANKYNLKGFSSYLSKKYKKIFKKNKEKTLKDINEDIRDIYERKISLFNLAGSMIFVNSEKKYKPKVIPNFYVLNDNFMKDPDTVASVSAYSYAWQLIREKKYTQARDFLFGIISKKSSQSMFYYAMGSLYLLEQKENAETNALKFFQEGILVDVDNERNMCYKGLMYLYMSYKGEISNDILYFARAVYSAAGDVSDEITAINMLNTSNYEIKHRTILQWTLNDLDRIKDLSEKNKIELVFASYPEDTDINEVVQQHIEQTSGGMLFFYNKFEFTGNMDYSLYNLSKKMFSFLRDRKILR